MDIQSVEKLIVAATKPLEKLVETLANGAGILYEPTNVRRLAEARADKAIIEAKADVRCADILHRAKLRHRLKDVRHQENLESVAEKAVKYLPQVVTEAPVDPDWTEEFAESCQSVSNDELQELWAQILATEVSKPGSTSRKTLRVAKSIERRDAIRFAAICALGVSVGDRLLALCQTNKSFIEYGLATPDLYELAKLDLIDEDLNVRAALPLSCQVRYFDEVWILDPEAEKPMNIPYIGFTDRGMELSRVVGASRLDNYPVYVTKQLAEMKIRMRRFRVLSDGKFQQIQS